MEVKRSSSFHLLWVLFLSWMITNGWSYLLLAISACMKWETGRRIALFYMGILWLPFTPEKILTISIAVFLLNCLYPNELELYKKLLEVKKRLVIRK